MGESILDGGGLLPFVLAALGLLVGAYGTLIGVGGALVLVPALLFLYPDADPLVITAVSLAVVLINSLGAAYAYGRQKRVDYKTGLLFAAGTLPGLLLGIWTLHQVSRPSFSLIFGLVMLLISAVLILKPHPESLPPDAGGHRRYNRPLGFSLSAAAGYLAGLLGIGGGVIHVPVMTHILRFPAHVATATSSFILVFTALAGSLVHLGAGRYGDNWSVIIWLAAGVIFGSQVGARLSRRLHGSVLIRLLAIALALTGLRLALG